MNSEQNSPKKTVLIDITFLFDQYARRGIGRAGRDVVKRILALNTTDKSFEIHLIGFNTLEQNIAQLEISALEDSNIKDQVIFHSLGSPKPSGIMNIFRWSGWFKPLIEEVRPDIFYALHFERGLPTAPIFAKTLSYIPKTVVFYPDAIPLAMPDFKFSKKGFIQNIIKKWFYKTLIKGVANAHLVLTCSEFSKQDIVKFVGVSAEKVKTIYLGIEKDFYKDIFNFDQGEQRTILGLYQVNDKNYFFYDSGIEANKNAEALLEVLKNVQNDPELPDYLVVTGGDFARGIGKAIHAKSPSATQFLELAASKGVLDKLITTDKISELDLRYLLFNSKAYINLSTYEGFHFGPLQAMAAEIPTIACNASCTPEVTKGGAFLIDLNNNDPETMNLAIRKIKEFLKDETLKSNLVKKGKEIAEEYSWDRTASETWEALKQLNSEVK